MIPRHAAPRILRLLEGFPIVTVTGPRQPGKTTLIRALLPGRPCVTLEAPAQREYARHRPAAFLRQFPQGAVIDEAQNAPELFSELQGVVGITGKMGQLVLAGSQNLSLLSRVTQSLAGRTAVVELLPLSIAELRGIADRTVKQWLSIQETCYLVHFVRPHVANFGKRLIKMPKTYMTDVGLAAALLGIRTEGEIQSHPLRGSLFETMVVNELQKARINAGLREPLHFWRDNIGTEVDAVMERGNEIAAVEIKSGPTVASDAFRQLDKWRKYATERGRFSAVHLDMVYGGDTRFTREGVDVLPWSAL